jgi:hypothetical protein
MSVVVAGVFAVVASFAIGREDGRFVAGYFAIDGVLPKNNLY